MFRGHDIQDAGASCSTVDNSLSSIFEHFHKWMSGLWVPGTCSSVSLTIHGEYIIYAKNSLYKRQGPGSCTTQVLAFCQAPSLPWKVIDKVIFCCVLIKLSTSHTPASYGNSITGLGPVPRSPPTGVVLWAWLLSGDHSWDGIVQTWGGSWFSIAQLNTSVF